MTVRNSVLSFVLGVCVALAGCATVDVTKTSKGYLDPSDPNNIEILKTQPSKSYDELGTVTVNGFAVDEVAKMHNAIRAKSAALGADAVILTQEGITPTAFSAKRWAIGVAIHYKK